jgi:hypothetical protein
MYGVVKTTVYLPEELKRRIEETAARTGRSEADVIREALERHTANEPPEPRFPLFDSGDPTLAERDEEILAEGFGED